MTSLRNKTIKKEKKRKEDFKLMLNGMFWVIIVSLTSSLLFVKLILIIQPILLNLLLSPFKSSSSSSSPYLRDDLDIGLFKKLYLYNYPVLFLFNERDIIIENIFNNSHFICPENNYSEDNISSSSSSTSSSSTSSSSCIRAPLCDLIIEDDATTEFGLNVERNILSIPEVQESIRIPRLRHSFSGDKIQFTNLTGSIHMV